jgi:hypothetical protein
MEAWALAILVGLLVATIADRRAKERRWPL